ncbi:MAG: methylmalonyl Co-A mutase-associated GTPase MeaB [Desulfomonilaceae bacterium]
MLAEKILKGDMRATARLIRRIDDGESGVFKELSLLYRHAGRAHIVGFTGSPGVGKSTLVDRVVTQFRRNQKTVGVLAIDPTSPFTGGAILGDRIRMQKHFMDEAVFIRSLATRGTFGGLTRSTADAIIVLDAMGKDIIIVETVGVGQDEIDIVHNAHTTVLVTVPGMGDDIQAIKAGLMEIGDIFVVNKAEREGAAKTVREIRFMLDMSSEKYRNSGWVPPVISTVAVEDHGVDELYKAILDHRGFLLGGDSAKLAVLEKRRIRNQLLDLVRENLVETALKRMGGETALDQIVDEIVARRKDPYGASTELVDNLLGVGSS